ncbi:fumarase, putative, partial [Eimeria maxima]
IGAQFGGKYFCHDVRVIRLPRHAASLPIVFMEELERDPSKYLPDIREEDLGDIAHAKLLDKLNKEGDLPDYFKEHPIYYAGPAKTPEGMISGSFGPTTAGRMDSYIPLFMSKGASLITIAKGNRSKQVAHACKQYGGVYLGAIGGPAARIAQHCIKEVQIIDYPELGMEAIWKIRVEDFPAFVIIDAKGNDFYSTWIP